MPRLRCLESSEVGASDSLITSVAKCENLESYCSATTREARQSWPNSLYFDRIRDATAGKGDECRGRVRRSRLKHRDYFVCPGHQPGGTSIESRCERGEYVFDLHEISHTNARRRMRCLWKMTSAIGGDADIPANCLSLPGTDLPHTVLLVESCAFERQSMKRLGNSGPKETVG
jgi:hypothetical protein